MKQSILLLFCLCCIQQSLAQYTLIPDTNFEQALIDLNIDSEGILDGQVLTSDLSGVTYLDVNDKQIEDLTGIEDFTNLVTLFCWHNLLTSLNTSENLLLEELYCDNNFFETPLDLSNNINLRLLSCTVSNLSSLDVSNNINLEVLFCGNEVDILPFNIITNLDLSNNINLKHLSVFDLHTLESLDLSANLNLEVVDAGMAWAPSNLTQLNLANGFNDNLIDVITLGNQDLLCIQVDDAEAATNGDYPYSEWFINEEASFSEDCNFGIFDILTETVQIYPNPTYEMITIESENEINSIKIYDVLGRIVLTKKSNFNKVDLSNLSSGLLLLQIETTKGALTKKLIKE